MIICLLYDLYMYIKYSSLYKMYIYLFSLLISYRRTYLTMLCLQFYLYLYIMY